MKITDSISANLTDWMSKKPELDTIKKVAAKSHVGFGTVRRIKNGETNPTITNLCDIARAFGRRVEDLLADTQNGANVVALATRQPEPQPYQTELHELLGLIEEMNDIGMQRLIGMAKLLAIEHPKRKKHTRQ